MERKYQEIKGQELGGGFWQYMGVKGGLWSWTDILHSCEDKNTIEPQITRGREATLATVWESLVCRVHDVDNWQFIEGRNSYVSH